MVAGELDLLRAELAGVERAACGLLSRVDPRDAPCFAQLQNLDAIAQKLGALAVFLETLATTAPAHCVGASSAAGQLALSGLAARLGGINPVTAAAGQSGEFDLFQQDDAGTEP